MFKRGEVVFFRTNEGFTGEAAVVRASHPERRLLDGNLDKRPNYYIRSRASGDVMRRRAEELSRVRLAA